MNRRTVTLCLSDGQVETLDAVEFVYGRPWAGIVAEAVAGWLDRTAADEDVAEAVRARRVHQARQRLRVVGDRE